jgi:putative membrane protein
MQNALLANVVAALVFAVLGLAIFAVSFVTLDRLTPFSLWKEIVEKQNVALAVLLGGIALAVSVIIAAAIV